MGKKFLMASSELKGKLSKKIENFELLVRLTKIKKEINFIHETRQQIVKTKWTE